MTPPRAVCFDLDDTLLDGRAIADVLADTCAVVAATCGIDAVDLRAANRQAWNAHWPEVEDGWMLGTLESTEVSFEIWRRALRACGVEDDAVAWFARTTWFRKEREAYCLFDDALAVLTAVGARVPISVITNGASAMQREKLRATGIEHAFSVVAISAEVRSAKPDAPIFEHALDRLGVSPGDAWHLGDSLERDIAGARAAGMTAVWINRAGAERMPGEPVPDLEIRSLSQLLDHLQLR